jgi:hypothetical protein
VHVHFWDQIEQLQNPTPGNIGPPLDAVLPFYRRFVEAHTNMTRPLFREDVPRRFSLNEKCEEAIGTSFA